MSSNLQGAGVLHGTQAEDYVVAPERLASKCAANPALIDRLPVCARTIIGSIRKRMKTMIDRLGDMLQFQTEALKLRGQRQALLSANIANADTPSYKAVDFDFAQALKEATSGGKTAEGGPALLYREPSQASLDGNSVELDVERGRFVDNSVRYEAALKFLNAQLKTMLAAMQG
jgi:flagellar basal-body rod protein FlgB